MERAAAAPSHTPHRQRVSPQVMRIVVFYASLSALWILLSDTLLEWLFSGHSSDHSGYLLAQTLKGWIFVAATTLLLYALMRRLVNDLLAGVRREQALETDKRRMLDLLEGIVEGSTDAIYAKDAEGRYVLFNRSAARMVGKSVHQVLGQDDRALFPPDQAVAIMAIDRRVMADDRPTTYREELDTAQGRSVFLTTKGPLHDAQGRVAGTFGMTVDITERDQVDEVARRWMRAFQAAQFGLAHVSARDNSFIEVNETFARQRGYLPEELKGRSVLDLHAPEEVAALTTCFRTIDQIGHLVFESVHVRKNGSRFPVMVEVATVKDAGGQVVSRIAYATDISARKAAEAALHKLSQAVEQCAESIVITDDQARIEYVNEAFVSSTGYGREEVMGQNPRILRSGKTPAETHVAMWNALAQGNSWKGMFHNRRKDGSEYVEFALLSPIRQSDGRITHYLAVKEDITEKKRNAEELDRHRAHLEEMVSSRTAELELAKQEAEAANVAKSAFLATMSHEIRTPMNGVIGIVDVLRQSSLSPHQMELADTIRDSAFSLLGIIDDILDFSKIEAGRLELEQESVSLETLVESVCDALQPMARARQVFVSLFVDPDLPERIRSDPLRLRQILTNLLGNGIKFSAGQDRPGRVAVRTELVDQDTVRFVVADNGIGMPPDIVSRLFTPFSQGDSSTTRRFGGTGLGLSICRRLTDLFDGDIRVDSVPGEGSAFTVTLPVTRASSGQGLPIVCALHGLECLIVTHRAHLARDWQTYLRHAGAAVRICPHIAAARREAAGASAGTVLVIDGALQDDELEALRGSFPVPDLCLVSVGDDWQRCPRSVAAGIVSVAGNAMHRGTLLEAVALAAGRIQPEKESEPAVTATPITSWPSIEEARDRGQLILVAEDDDINQKVIRRQLALLGVACEIAGDGAEALRRWRGGSHALLLTDLHMPQMDGYELATRIRQEEGEGRSMPIIALTANVRNGEVGQCKAVGMDDYLAKPLQIDMLQRTLARWMPAAPRSDVPAQASRLAHEAGQSEPAVLDTRVLKALIGDDPALVRELLQDFLDAADKAAVELGAAVRAGDWGGAGAVGHRLKSSSRAVGALTLGAVCERLEAAGKGGEGERVQGVMEEFDRALMQVVVAIKDDARRV